MIAQIVQSIINLYKCVNIGQDTHNRIHALIQSGICEKTQKWAEKLIFSYLLTAFPWYFLIYRDHFLSCRLPIRHTLYL